MKTPAIKPAELAITLHLFDLDGTLADSKTGLYASFRAGLAVIGCPPQTDAALARFLGTPLPIVFRTVRPDVSAGDIDRGIQAFRAHYDRAGILGNDLYLGVPELLRAVRNAGRRNWIVTSKPEMHAVRVASLLGIDALIDGMVGAGLDETDTKADLVARALSDAAVPAANALMLGDRHYDVTGALVNGVTAVGALWGYGSRPELAQAGCRLFSDSPDAFRRDFVDQPMTALS
jgi:phosphoglycolate phosphatase